MGGTAGRTQRRRGAFVLLLVLLALAGARPVLAAGQTGSYDTAEECIAAQPAELNPLAVRCMTRPDGKWVRITGSRAGGGAGSSGFGTFLTIAVVWSAVPLVIAVGLARRRRESPGVAVLLTLFLGWIGLAIVYFGQARARDAVEGLASQPPLPPPAAGPESVEDRLRQLDRLRADQLVSDDEYERQRRRIVESI